MGLSRAFVGAVTVVASLGQISAHPDFSKWAPAGPGDVRGPCPALNSLANHDILPHDGKGVTIPILTKALQEGLNVATDFSVLIGGAGIMSADNPLGLSFDLDDLSKHEQIIEHDGSLTRGDAYFGDNHSFNDTIWQTVFAYFKDAETVDFATAAEARYNRILVASERNPDFTYSAKDIILSYGETALYLSVLGDPVTGHPPVEWVKIFFEEERLPFNEGWTPRTIPTTMASIEAMTILLNVISGETLPEGLMMTKNTLAKVFAGDPLKGIVGELPTILGQKAPASAEDLAGLKQKLSHAGEDLPLNPDQLPGADGLPVKGLPL